MIAAERAGASHRADSAPCAPAGERAVRTSLPPAGREYDFFSWRNLRLWGEPGKPGKKQYVCRAAHQKFLYGLKSLFRGKGLLTGWRSDESFHNVSPEEKKSMYKSVAFHFSRQLYLYAFNMDDWLQDHMVKTHCSGHRVDAGSGTDTAHAAAGTSPCLPRCCQPQT